MTYESDARSEPCAGRKLPFHGGVTLRQIWSVDCPDCKALAGSRCTTPGGYHSPTHKARIELAKTAT